MGVATLSYHFPLSSSLLQVWKDGAKAANPVSVVPYASGLIHPFLNPVPDRCGRTAPRWTSWWVLPRTGSRRWWRSTSEH